MRIGTGWDRHPLKEGRPCILGGVLFEDEPRGPDGHSDADVLVHAVIDALLGAAALGDIGSHFPDTDPAWQGADSLDLLSRTARILDEAGWRVGNVDSVIIAERPKIAPRSGEMRRRMAGRLGVDTGRISVKATRGEGLGPEGRAECITAQAVALLEEK